jgi:hypothetical protein
VAAAAAAAAAAHRRWLAWRLRRQFVGIVASAVAEERQDVLPPRAATVATKTLAVAAIAGAQTAINNKLKASEATTTKMVMATSIKM